MTSAPTTAEAPLTDLQRVCNFIMKHGYATGHADDIDDALAELGGQMDETWEKYKSTKAENDALLAAIKDRDATIAHQAAQIAVLVEALRFYAVTGGAWRSQIYQHKEGVTWWPSEALLGDCGLRADRALANLPAAAHALLDEKARLVEDVNILNQMLRDKTAAGQGEIDYEASLIDRAEKAEAELARLQATQRTPGTVEVCQQCHAENGPKDRWNDCPHTECPLRQPTPTSAGES